SPAQPTAKKEERGEKRATDEPPLRKGAAEFRRRHLQYLGFLRLHARTRESRGSLQHRHIADEIARLRDGENLFFAFSRFEDFDFAAKNDRQSEVTLAGFVNQLAFFYRPASAQSLELLQLAIVELGKGNGSS